MHRALEPIGIFLVSGAAAGTAVWTLFGPTGPGLPIDPAMTLLLLTLLLLYAAGGVLGALSGVRTDRMRRIFFLGGFVTLCLAFLSPLDELGRQFFALHMVQHLLVIIVAAPLLAASDVSGAIRRTVPPEIRRWIAISAAGRAMAGWSRSPAAAWTAAAAFAAVVAIWHIPAAHDWAVIVMPAHLLEQISVATAAILFWKVIFESGHRRIGRGAAALMVALISLEGALISAVLMFATAPLCRSYAGNPVRDQVLAGLLMCIPASFAYVGSTVWGLARMLGDGRSHA